MVRVYAVASAKGGVGKTTTTANLGAMLAAAGRDVVVIDGDIGMANLGAALGVTPDGATLHDVLAGDATPRDAAYDGPEGLTVVPGSTTLDAFATADPSRLEAVVAAFDDADVVLVDVGAGVSHETSAPLSLADDVLLVSTAERDALVDTDKTRQLTDRLGGSVRGVVLTRADPETRDVTIVERHLDAVTLAFVPEDEAVRESVAAGEPLVSYAAEGPAAEAYRQLSGLLIGDVAAAAAPGPADPEIEGGESDSLIEEAESIESTAATAGEGTEANLEAKVDEVAVDEAAEAAPTAVGAPESGVTATEPADPEETDVPAEAIPFSSPASAPNDESAAIEGRNDETEVRSDESSDENIVKEAEKADENIVKEAEKADENIVKEAEKADENIVKEAEKTGEATTGAEEEEAAASEPTDSKADASADEGGKKGFLRRFF
ncbi:AAA family ATPase [Haloferacaceae archaeon DSL9]